MTEPTEAAVVRMLIARHEAKAEQVFLNPVRQTLLTECAALRAVMKAAGWSLEEDGEDVGN